MNEQPPKPPENASEEELKQTPSQEENLTPKALLNRVFEGDKFPTKEVLQSILERFVKGREYKEVKFQADENGVVVYEIETTDERGDLVVYNFQRAKYNYLDPTLPKDTQASASIQVVFYTDGEPVGGECVANYLYGKWEYPE